MEALRILVIEDDNGVFKSYEDEANIFNDENTYYCYKLIHCSDKAEGLEKLKANDADYSGAIVDLNLDPAREDDCSGMEIVDYIKNNLRFPVFIISGTTHHLSDEQAEQNELYKVIERGMDFDFTEEFKKIYETGIVELLNNTGLVEKYINQIFWNHLSNSLEPWINDQCTNKEAKKKSLLRYALSHLQEYLDTNEFGKDLIYNPAEFFITGPIKEHIYTGDVFIKNNDTYVIITPACDISQKKADNVLCLKIVNPNKIQKIVNQETQKVKTKELEKFLGNNAGERFHFVPSLRYKGKEYLEGIIDFQSHMSFSHEELTKDLENNRIERYATISQPFLKDLIERYSRYYSRQGSPDFPRDKLKNLYLSKYEG